MVKWASLPCGTYLPQTPTIDLFCLLIFIASQDSTTALPVSCISYSLSFSPSLSFALPHPWTLFLCLIYKSTHSLSLPLSPSYLSPPLCHLPSLSVRCCVPSVSVLCISDGWPFLVWRLLSLLSVWAALRVCVFCILSSRGRQMSRPFFLLLLCLFCVSQPGLWQLRCLKIFNPNIWICSAFTQVFDVCFYDGISLNLIYWSILL